MIQGIIATRTVLIDGKPLDYHSSLKLYNHSPTGFMWGYHGSGPAQLALALLYHFTKNKEYSLNNYQRFKKEVIAALHMGNFTMTNTLVTDWIKRHEA